MNEELKLLWKCKKSTKKVLCNIKKNKKCGEGEGQYLNPKHSQCIKKN